MTNNIHGEWRAPERGEHFRRCNYCGGMHPEDFLRVLREGARPDMADWKYGWPHKFYIDVPNRDPSAIFCVGSRHDAYAPGGESYTPPEPGYIAFDDLTPQQWEIVKRDGMGRDGDRTEGVYYQFGTRLAHFGKFYTKHMIDADLAMREAINCFLPIEFIVVPVGATIDGFANNGDKPQLFYRRISA